MIIEFQIDDQGTSSLIDSTILLIKSYDGNKWFGGIRLESHIVRRESQDLRNHGYTLYRDNNKHLVILVDEVNWPEKLKYLEIIWKRDQILNQLL